MMTRSVHPAVLLAAGVFLGWAVAQPFPSTAHHGNDSQHQHRTRSGLDQTGPGGSCEVAADHR